MDYCKDIYFESIEHIVNFVHKALQPVCMALNDGDEKELSKKMRLSVDVGSYCKDYCKEQKKCQ